MLPITLARTRLARNLDNIRAGVRTKREQRVEDLLARGYQRAFGVDTSGAVAHFREVLAVDPDNEPARFGLRFLSASSHRHMKIHAPTESMPITTTATISGIYPQGNPSCRRHT